MMREPQRSVLRAFAIAAEQAAELLRSSQGKGQSNTEQAARILLQHCGSRLTHYMRRESYGHAQEEDLEELIADVIMAFMASPPVVDCPAEAWLFSIARSKVLDWARKRRAEKRGGSQNQDLSLDDEEMEHLLDTAHGHIEIPAWVRDCIHRASAALEQENPERAMVLLMVADGWSAEEIAIYFGADPARITDAQKAAARDRRYRAKLLAQQYFEHCKD